MNKIKDWLSPPIFEGDAEKTRLARIGNAIVLAIIAVLGIYTFARPKLFLENTEAAIANAILLLLLISQLFVIRRGWVRAATLTLAVLVWSNLTVQIWLFGGVRDAGFAAYLLIILAASLVLGWRAATLFLLLSISAGLGMAHAEVVGILPFAPDGPYTLWLDHSLNFVIATILVTVMVTDLNRTLARAGHNEQNLAERNRELRATQTLLEAQIAEREQAQHKLRASERRYRQLVKYAPAGIYEVDLTNRRFTDVNDVMCEHTGYSKEEFLSLNPYQLLSEDSWEQFQARSEKLHAGEVVPETVEYKIRSKDGQEFWALVNTRVVPEHEQPVRATVIAHNITDRKQAETALKQSEERHRLVVENANEAIVVAQDGQLKFFNSKLMEFTGCYSRDEMRYTPFTEFIHPDDRAMVLDRHLKRLKQEECPQVYAFRVLDKDGKITWVEINAIRINWEDKPAILFFLSDITERKQAQDKLIESENQYRQAVENSPNPIFNVDRTGNIITWNPACETLFQHGKELIGRSYQSIMWDEATGCAVKNWLVEVFEHTQSLSGVEITYRCKDGTKRTTVSRLYPTLGHQGEVEACVFANTDITERVQVEEALRESEEKYRHLVKYAPAGIYEIDFANSRFIDVNDVMCEYMGYSRAEFLTLSVFDILTEDSKQQFINRTDKVLAGEPIPETIEFRVKSRSGEELWVLVNSRIVFEDDRPVKGTVIAHNITERKKTEAELEMYRSHLEELVKERTAQLTNVNLQLESEIAERRRAEQALTESHERLLTILDGIDADIYVADMASYEILFMNRHMQNLFGQALVGHVCWQAFRGESGPCAYCTNDKLVDPEGKSTGVHVWEGYNPIIGKWTMNYDRAIRWVDGRWVSLQIGMDITDRKQAEEQIKTSLKEKEVLLQEIHHRVKNNLQVVSSLLSLQSGYIKDQQVINIFQDSQHRVQSMALIHEKLYRSENLAHIDFAEYIRELAGFLLKAQNGPSQGITCTIQADPVYLNIDTAVPCGLILNELVSNSLKHAFPDSRPGEIRIELNADSSPQLILTVSDNGVGIPNDVDFYNTASLGLNLVNSLVDQLDGTIELNHEAGTEIKIRFTYPGTRV